MTSRFRVFYTRRKVSSQRGGESAAERTHGGAIARRRCGRECAVTRIRDDSPSPSTPPASGKRSPLSSSWRRCIGCAHSFGRPPRGAFRSAERTGPRTTWSRTTHARHVRPDLTSSLGSRRPRRDRDRAASRRAFFRPFRGSPCTLVHAASPPID